MARIFIISNRVGVPNRDGKKNVGGLEVALRSTLKQRSCVWLGWSGEIKPHEEVETHFITGRDANYIVTDLSEEDYQEYYSGFANRVLWPILHYRLDLAEFSRRDLTGYLRVNENFADQLVKVLKPDDIVWVHDYHLIPLAKALRDRGMQNKIGFFLHIPLPPPEILTALPHHERLISSLVHYDLIGFQTNDDASNLARYLANELQWPMHIPQNKLLGVTRMRIGIFPVGIETNAYQRCGERAYKTKFIRALQNSTPGAIMIGVDRLDYTKGLPLKFEAYERFLSANPEWRGKITYLQITPKSRSDIQEYIEMEHTIDVTAGRINGAYGEVSWTPVRYVNRAYSRTALAGLYRAAQVGLVTPLRDGMNLVAKEYVAAQDPDNPGVLILSRFAGAAEELGAALLTNPYDPETTGAAIKRALSMPLNERKSRYETLYKAILKNDISHWGEKFLSSLTGQESKISA